MPADAGETRCDRQAELTEGPRHEQGASAAELAEEGPDLGQAQADDHARSCSPAKTTNASATRERDRPEADASEISRVTSRP